MNPGPVRRASGVLLASPSSLLHRLVQQFLAQLRCQTLKPVNSLCLRVSAGPLCSSTVLLSPKAVLVDLPLRQKGHYLKKGFVLSYTLSLALRLTLFMDFKI